MTMLQAWSFGFASTSHPQAIKPSASHPQARDQPGTRRVAGSHSRPYRKDDEVRRFGRLRSLRAALVATALAAAAGLAVFAAPAQAAPAAVTNGTQFTDTGGNGVHAHGGGVIKVGDYYYWFGENRNPDDTF